MNPPMMGPGSQCTAEIDELQGAGQTSRMPDSASYLKRKTTNSGYEYQRFKSIGGR